MRCREGRRGVASRPAEQHVEGVREQQLGKDQVGGFIHLGPIPTPIEKDRALRAGLHVMLFPENDLEFEDSLSKKSGPRG
jgi:hypothetical protein